MVFVFNHRKWNEHYGQLKRYKAEHGDCNVPYKYSGNPGLSGWVIQQRNAYKEGTVTIKRIERLERIGFIWRPRNDLWEHRYNRLLEFRKENGHCNVPQKHPELGNWVQEHRRKYKKGLVPQERITLLESVGFKWTVRPNNQAPIDRWENHYKQLLDFRRENGHCNAHQKHLTLGIWVRDQRVLYKRGSLSEERISLLENIEFEWDRKYARGGKACKPKEEPIASTGVQEGLGESGGGKTVTKQIENPEEECASWELDEADRCSDSSKGGATSCAEPPAANLVQGEIEKETASDGAAGVNRATEAMTLVGRKRRTFD